MLRPPFLTERGKILSVVVTVVFLVSDGIRFSPINFLRSCRYSCMSGSSSKKGQFGSHNFSLFLIQFLRGCFGMLWEFQMVFACFDTVFVLKSWQADALPMADLSAWWPFKLSTYLCLKNFSAFSRRYFFAIQWHFVMWYPNAGPCSASSWWRRCRSFRFPTEIPFKKKLSNATLKFISTHTRRTVGQVSFVRWFDYQILWRDQTRRSSVSIFILGIHWRSDWQIGDENVLM